MPPVLSQLDARVFFALYGEGGGSLLGAALFLSAIGSGWAMLWLLPAMGVRRWRPFAASLLATLAASATTVYLLKAVVGRVRPCMALAGVRALCAAPTDPSFPSGHACGSFTLAAFVVVALEAWAAKEPSRAKAAARVGVVAVATGIAWSRVYLGVHFPADVAVGALLGASFGTIGGLLYLRYLRQVARTSAPGASFDPAIAPP